MNGARLAAMVASALWAATASAAEMVLLEAEAFQQTGGWVVDQQFMDQMGSPYLLAHGLGTPVADAVTTARLPPTQTQEPQTDHGTWRVWVRTRDWVPGHGPGRFQVVVDGRPLDATFGTQGGGRWVWQDGGTVRPAGPVVTVALRDLTGFEGRCDAVLFVRSEGDQWRPPDDPGELAAMRRRAMGIPDEPPDGGRFDFVVVGGGYAGVCAAVSAARLGLRVALVQDRPVLGGNASSEVRVIPIGKLNTGPYPRNADVMRDLVPWEFDRRLAPEAYKWNDDRPLRVVRAEKNVTLLLEHRVTDACTREGRLESVVATHVRTGRRLRLRAPLFADCTGDGCVGYLAGAEWRMGREGRSETGESFAPESPDRMVMGMSNYWRAVETGQPTQFPECPWALQVTEENYEIPPPRWPPKPQPGVIASGGWNWESGFLCDPIADAEQVRDHNFRAIYGTWAFLKNRSKDRQKYATARLDWVAYVLGKRESRRLVGDLVLTEQDILERRRYPDGCVTATWYFDIHYPHPVNSRHFPGQEFRSIAYDDPNFEKYRGDIPGRYTPIEPYEIPFRCFYSRNVPNLMMAGRCISVTHVALAPVRVMNTTGMMGTVVGRAAFLCRKFNCNPRDIYQKHLDALKALLTDPDSAGR